MVETRLERCNTRIDKWIKENRKLCEDPEVKTEVAKKIGDIRSWARGGMPECAVQSNLDDMEGIYGVGGILRRKKG